MGIGTRMDELILRRVDYVSGLEPLVRIRTSLVRFHLVLSSSSVCMTPHLPA